QRSYRLWQEHRPLFKHPLFDKSFSGVAADEKRFDPRHFCLYLTVGLPAALFRHDSIQYDQFCFLGVLPEQRHGFLAIFCHQDGITELLKETLDDLQDFFVIFYKQKCLISPQLTFVSYLWKLLLFSFSLFRFEIKREVNVELRPFTRLAVAGKKPLALFYTAVDD